MSADQTTPPELVSRLRWLASEHWAGRHGLGDDMAVEIDRAAAEIERLRAALARMARGDLPSNYAGTGNGYRAFAHDTLNPEHVT